VIAEYERLAEGRDAAIETMRTGIAATEGFKQSL